MSPRAVAYQCAMCQGFVEALAGGLCEACLAGRPPRRTRKPRKAPLRRAQAQDGQSRTGPRVEEEG